MKNKALVFFLAGAMQLQAATVVTVYRDYDGDGARDAGEPGVIGASANAYAATGSPISGTTGNDGTVSLATTDGVAYRIEVSSPSALVMGGAGTTGLRSNVQFGSDPVGVGNLALSFGASNPSQYCASASDADLISIKNVREQLAGTTAQQTITSWNYLDDSTAAVGAQTVWAVDQSGTGVVGTGAQWGLAYRKRGDIAFSGSFVRGASPLGGSAPEESTGNIYRSTRNAAGAVTTSLYIDLNAAAYGTIDLGTNPHPRATVTNYDTLPLPAREETGKFGLGDIDLSEDESRLYAVNLFQKELLVIPMGTALVPTVPASDATIGRISIPRPTGTNGCANDADFRPFAIGINDGNVYVGAVCTAQNVAPTTDPLNAARQAAMRGYVLQLNAAGTAFLAAPVLNFSLDYPRQFANDGVDFAASGNWLPWNDDPALAGTGYGNTTLIAYPQAILSDLAFDNFGFMTIGLTDRLNFQRFDEAIGGQPGSRFAGDMLLACENGSGGFDIENNGSCTARGVTRTTLDPANNGTAPDDNTNSGPGGREFYFGERYNYTLSTATTDSALNSPDFHREAATGGLALLGGQGGVVSTAYDIGGTFNNGIRVMSQGNLPETNTGLMYRDGGYMAAPDSPTLNDQYHEFRLIEGNVYFGKGNGLGDVEVLCEAAQPIQIGNLVFNDLNGDGVQGPGEPGIASITVELRNSAGALIGRTTTDANGNYAFNVREIDTGTDASTTDSDVQLLFANLYGASVSVSIPGTTITGVGSGGTNNIDASMRLTTPDVASGADSDNRDSEGVIITPPTQTARAGVSVTLPVAAGQSNYSIDFGFVPTDFGDLPDAGAGIGAGNYETLLANGGPSNLMNSNLRLGAAVGTLTTGYDSEATGVSSVAADGDNLAGDNDENGLVTFPALRPGVAPTVTVSVFNNTGTVRNVCGYIDFNNNGSFADAGEFVSTTVPSSATPQNINLIFSGSFVNAQAFANNYVYTRFRAQELSCSSLGYGGFGEVEDFAIPVANVNVTLSAIPAYCPGGSTTYTITFTNPSTRAASVYPITADLVGINEAGIAGVPVFAVANWAVTSGTGSLATSSGSGDINTTATIPAGGSVVVTVQGVFANTATGAQSTSADIVPSVGSVDSNSSDDLASGSAAQSSSATCAANLTGTGALCPNLTASGIGALNPQPLSCDTAGERVVNRYYASVASVSAAGRCVRVGASTGSGPAISAGDILLIVQMQGATINSSNNDSYGDNVSGAPGGATTTATTAGQFEYVIAQTGILPTGNANCSGTDVVEISGSGALNSTNSHGLRNAYVHNPAAALRSVYQIVRVPVYTSVNFSSTCSVGAPSWNGSTGGIVSFDATQGINLGSSSVTRIDASADGFRPGVCAVATVENSGTFYAAATSATVSGKGEGFAGTPLAVQAGTGGYTGGDFGRGAPGNAGGGGQFCASLLSLSDRATGGGGGAGRSVGGVGGNDVSGLLSDCLLSGHGGGVLPANNDASRLVLGGGGGAGATDDACSGTPGTGGGIVMLRARELFGQGTISVQATAGTGTADTDTAVNGGGGGGTIVLMTSIAGANSYGGIVFAANGGAGAAGSTFEGAGGGGGAGNLYRSPVAAGTALGTVQVSGGTVTAGTGAVAGSNSTVGSVDPVNGSPGVKPSYICAQNATVPVTLSYVDVRDQGGELVVNFQTASEAGTLGYRILADLGTPGREVQARVEIGSVASRRIDSLVEQSYQVRARNPGASQIWIEESSVDGKSELYGPYPIGQAIGERGLSSALNWALVHAEQDAYRAERAQGLRGLSAKIAELRVDRDRWVQLSHADLLAVGVDLTGVQSKDIAVRKGSETIAAQITEGVFGSGSTIAFFAPAVNDSIYTRTAVYRIEQGRGLSAATLDARGRGELAEIRSVSGQMEFAANTTYSFSSPLDDPWFSFRALRSGAGAGVGSVELVIKDLAEVSTRAVTSEQYVEVRYWGGLDYAGAGADHHAVFKLNGVNLGEVQFDGFASGTQRFALPANVLKNGGNSFTVELPATTGYAADIVNIESVRLHYARRLLVQSDQLDVELPATPAPATDARAASTGDDRTPAAPNESLFVLEGLSSTPVVTLLERGDEVIVLQTEAPKNGQMTVKLTAQAGDRLRVLPISSTELSLSAVAAVEDPISGPAASYLILSHPSFINALGPMVLAKQQQGFSVKVVDVEAVYRYYSAGVVDPAAIQLAIRRAKSSLGTTHVLLVGGDSYDYHNVLGVNSISFIPTNYRRTDAIIAWAPSDAVYADTNGDGASDVALGRWPVRTVAELNAIMTKTLSYQNRHHSLFVNDRALNGVSYASDIPTMSALLGDNWQNSQLSLDEYASGSAGDARAEMVSRLADGATLLGYYGHSAPAAWSRESLLTATQVNAGLFNGVTQPFATVQLGCWGTYFVEPTSTTVAHALLLQPRGAALVLGASSLTAASSDLALAGVLFPRLNSESFGEASMHAQGQLLLQQPQPQDVILGLTLLGDPALK